jgi:hypothetical protein
LLYSCFYPAVKWNFGNSEIIVTGATDSKCEDPDAYADLRTALSTKVLPSDQIAPGTL